MMPEQLTPEQFIVNIQRALPRLSETELAKLKKQARAWATVFYTGDIPAQMNQSLLDLEAKHAIA